MLFCLNLFLGIFLIKIALLYHFRPPPQDLLLCTSPSFAVVLHRLSLYFACSLRASVPCGTVEVTATIFDLRKSFVTSQANFNKNITSTSNAIQILKTVATLTFFPPSIDKSGQVLQVVPTPIA